MAHRATTSAYASATSVTVTAPSGIADDDILICALLQYKSGGGTTFTWPSGFTEIYQRQATTNFRAGIAWKRASSESGDYTITASDTGDLIGIVSAYSGRIASGSPVDVGSDTSYTTNDANVRGAGVTIATAGSDLLWCGFSYRSDQNDLSVPSGMNSRADVHDGYECFALADLLDQSTGASGDKDGTLGDVTTTKHAFLVALKPAASATTFIPHVMCHKSIPPFVGGPNG